MVPNYWRQDLWSYIYTCTLILVQLKEYLWRKIIPTVCRLVFDISEILYVVIPFISLLIICVFLLRVVVNSGTCMLIFEVLCGEISVILPKFLFWLLRFTTTSKLVDQLRNVVTLPFYLVDHQRKFQLSYEWETTSLIRWSINGFFLLLCVDVSANTLL